MKTFDLTSIVDHVRETVLRHRLGPGSYARYLWQDSQHPRSLGEEPYGCADAMNLLYTIGDFPREPAERQACIGHLRGLQQEDGFYRASDHHYYHTTAHCSAALELFDAAPLLQPQMPAELLDGTGLEAFLGSLKWNTDPWNQSHIGAGIFVFMNLNGLATPEWNQRYFQWFWDNADPRTGFWNGPVDNIHPTKPALHSIAGTFHYLFNHEYGRMPLRYPEKLIDSCIDAYDTALKDNPLFGHAAHFWEIDWVFCLTRASRQTPHRFYDVRDRLEAFTADTLDWWFGVDWDTDEGLNDLHTLFGAVCTLAELQQTLRGTLRTFKPLRLVMDRRPFI